LGAKKTFQLTAALLLLIDRSVIAY